jgi:CubicO group peptidase (beta-lactamase class C family)
MASCSEDRPPIHSRPDDPPAPQGYQYRLPDSTGDGWIPSHLDSVDMNREIVERMMDSVSDSTMPDLHSIVVAKDGYLVFEEYFNGWHPDSLHMLMSCTKSVTSTLLGIAIDRGYISGVDESLYGYFSEYSHLGSPAKDSILLRHALSFTPGLDWDQVTYPYSDWRNTLTEMVYCRCDWLEFILGRDVAALPGTEFAYSDGTAILLGEVIKRSTGRPVSQWADEVLFGPLGITDRDWLYGQATITNTGWGLYLRSRDMAKFGQLILNEGLWEGQRVVSSAWLDEATTPKYQFAYNLGYGYLWWWRRIITDNSLILRMNNAAGNMGQYIFVIPQWQMVVVMTQGRPTGLGWTSLQWAMFDHLFPAVEAGASK